MTSSAIEEKIRGIVAEIAELVPENVTAQADFVKELGVDSMAALELMAALEDEFGIVIDPDSMPELSSLQSCTNLVKGLLDAE
jgi:acyl carrier protein